MHIKHKIKLMEHGWSLILKEETEEKNLVKEIKERQLRDYGTTQTPGVKFQE